MRAAQVDEPKQLCQGGRVGVHCSGGVAEMAQWVSALQGLTPQSGDGHIRASMVGQDAADGHDKVLVQRGGIQGGAHAQRRKEAVAEQLLHALAGDVFQQTSQQAKAEIAVDQPLAGPACPDGVVRQHIVEGAALAQGCIHGGHVRKTAGVAEQVADGHAVQHGCVLRIRQQRADG